MIALNATSNAIYEQARKEGFVTIVDDAVGKVIEGNTEKFSGYSKLKMREVKL